MFLRPGSLLCTRRSRGSGEENALNAISVGAGLPGFEPTLIQSGQNAVHFMMGKLREIHRIRYFSIFYPLINISNL